MGAIRYISLLSKGIATTSERYSLAMTGNLEAKPFKHQFIGELSVQDFSQQAVLVQPGDADGSYPVMKARSFGPDADIVSGVAGA